MLSCKQVSEQASDDIDGRYRGWHKLQIRLHLMICSHCRRFRRHLLHSRQVAATLAHRLWAGRDADSAEQILQQIKQRSDKPAAPGDG